MPRASPPGTADRGTNQRGRPTARSARAEPRALGAPGAPGWGGAAGAVGMGAGADGVAATPSRLSGGGARKERSRVTHPRGASRPSTAGP
eukprot:7327741-Pyramimonas_sp.AAC.1